MLRHSRIFPSVEQILIAYGLIAGSTSFDVAVRAAPGERIRFLRRAANRQLLIFLLRKKWIVAKMFLRPRCAAYGAGGRRKEVSGKSETRTRQRRFTV